ncbi:hypothetical protein B9Z19DRAFT_1123059 [Tuber borchii]|uniref:Uncharacterized protein n=1 Tax=Tuber borchii TaxID=42251 RepID=A0A2T6ZZA6_TUBBO|nr:hypothetical protein B9Z19DRAFT_1123059 [Tuber borchii]
MCPSDGYEEITFRFLAPQIADAIYECINETIVCLTCAILCHTLRAWRTGALLDPPEFKSEAVRGKSFLISGPFVPFVQDVESSQIRKIFSYGRGTHGGGSQGQRKSLMLRNLRETIMDKVNQENRVLKERREGFADNHEAVHAELERQLSSRNPRRPAAREPTPINTGARGLVGRLESQLERELSSQEPRRAAAREPTPINTDGRVLEGHQESQDASQESAKSFDFSQSAFARALRGLNAESVTFDDSLDLTLEQEQESAANPDLASRLSLNLDDFQEDQAAVGENVRQNGDESSHLHHAPPNATGALERPAKHARRRTLQSTTYADIETEHDAQATTETVRLSDESSDEDQNSRGSDQTELDTEPDAEDNDIPEATGAGLHHRP